MKQKVLYLFLSLMLMSISVSAQTGGGRITGVVIDDSGEEPLPGTTIFIEELKKGKWVKKTLSRWNAALMLSTLTF